MSWALCYTRLGAFVILLRGAQAATFWRLQGSSTGSSHRVLFQRVSPVTRVGSTSFFDTYKRQHHEFRWIYSPASDCRRGSEFHCTMKWASIQEVQRSSFVADAQSLMVIPGCGCQGNFVMYLQPWPKHPSFLLVVASVACLEVENSLTQNLLAVISLIIAWNWGMLFTFCGLWSQLYCKLHPYTPFGTRGRTCLELWVLHNDNVLTHCMSKTVFFVLFCFFV